MTLHERPLTISPVKKESPSKPLTPKPDTIRCGCGLQFPDLNGLFYHQVASFHFENNYCVLCNRTFSKGSNFKRHIREIHEQHKVTCWVCNRQYVRPDRLKLHFEDAHNMMLCSKCNAIFGTREELKSHISKCFQK